MVLLQFLDRVVHTEAETIQDLLKEVLKLFGLKESEVLLIHFELKDGTLIHTDDDLRKLSRNTVVKVVRNDGKVSKPDEEGKASGKNVADKTDPGPPEDPEPSPDSPQGPTSNKSSGIGRKLMYGLIGGAVVAVAAPVAVTAGVAALGFGAGGIGAGSVAASMMSASAIANGGGVAAGSAVAVLQSIGAAGLGATGVAASVGAGATVGAAAGVGASAVVDKLKGNPPDPDNGNPDDGDQPQS